MARVALGVASAHSPQVSTPVDLWSAHAARDRNNQRLLGVDGQIRNYEEQLAVADPAIAAQVTPEKWAERHAACQAALAQIAGAVAEVRPDVIVIIGDDQDEVFHDDNFPAISIYWGETAPALPWKPSYPLPNYEAWAWAYGPESPTEYAIDAALGRHLITSLMAQDFDVGSSRRLNEGVGIGHAWTFARQRWMTHGAVPMVPVLLNTYYPPNQPTPRRCYALGRALRRAIESYPADLRVAIGASGGLSHFIVDEKLDRALLDGLARGDEAAITGLPVNLLNSGSSEIRNWIAAAGDLEGLPLAWSAYEPAYRTPAGTGCGMGFAIWREGA
jgi:hypothetical protein